MLLYLFLVIIIVIGIILLAMLIVRRRNPEFKPTPLGEQPGLNNLDALVSSVKRKPERQQVKTDSESEKTQQQKDEESDQQSEKTQTEEQEQNQSGQRKPRGKPPKRLPGINLHQAMKTSEIIGPPKGYT